MPLKLDKFSSETFKITSEEWIASAGSFGIPSLDYERVLEWARNRINYENVHNDSVAYGVFKDGAEESLAIVDIIYSKRPGPDIGWLKMIDISMSPAYSPTEVESNAEKLAEVLDIYSEAIIGTIQLTSNHNARVIKIYGRNDHLLQLLIALNERLRAKFTEKLTTKFEGRWLVISAH